MRERTFSREKGWAPVQSGWTTTYFFASPRLICLDTMHSELSGAAKYKRGVSASRKAAVCGTGGGLHPVATWKSSMKSAPCPSRTCPNPLRVLQRIWSLHTQMPTSKGSQLGWGSMAGFQVHPLQNGSPLFGLSLELMHA